jgi:hypothetical protein
MKNKSLSYLYALGLFILTISVAQAAQYFKVGDKVTGGGWSSSTSHGNVITQLVDNRFVVYFLDKNQQVTQPPAGQATISYVADGKSYTTPITRSSAYLKSQRKIEPAKQYFIRIMVTDTNRSQQPDNNKELKDKKPVENDKKGKFF